MKRMRTWIVIISADPACAQALGETLEAAGYSFTLVSDVASFLDLKWSAHPYCIVLDIDPEQHSLASIFKLAKAPWRWPTIVANIHGELPTIVKLMRFRHFEFFQNPYTPGGLLTSIRHAEKFRPYKRPHEQLQRHDKLSQNLRKLSRRETLIAGEMIYGSTSKAISTKFSISENTVELHRTRVLRKMDVRSTGELVRLYLSSGIN